MKTRRNAANEIPSQAGERAGAAQTADRAGGRQAAGGVSRGAARVAQQHARVAQGESRGRGRSVAQGARSGVRAGARVARSDAQRSGAHASVLPNAAGAYAQARKQQIARNKVFALLAAIVALLTAWALMQPASALTLTCGLEEHTHSEACYEQVLACGLDEGDLDENGTPHVHSDTCYETQLTCGFDEHAHSDACYEESEGDSVLSTLLAATPLAASSSETGNAEDDADAQTASDLAGAGSIAALAANDGIAAQAVDVNNLNGKTFAIVNQANSLAMLSTSTTSGKLDGATARIVSEQDNEYMLIPEGYFAKDYIVWHFEKTEYNGNSYYIWVENAQGDHSGYLTISDVNVTVESSKTQDSVITVKEGTGNYAGMVRLTNSKGQAVNRYGGQTYFGGFSDNTANEYFYLFNGETRSLSAGTVEGITPAGTVINMFDYWTTERWPSRGDQNTDKMQNGGINANNGMPRNLLFDYQTTRGTFNFYTGSEAVFPGIVNNTLSNDGYPTLAADKGGDSLSYLFDPSVSVDGKASFDGVKKLLQIDESGYYYYDSTKNFAELDDESKEITLYDSWGVLPVGANSPLGQFFPFNSFKNSALSTSTGADINHYHGLTLTSRFVQKYSGHTSSAQDALPTTFEFAGDDDVWIFVDGVLVADLGGIHDRASTKIDFSTGEVFINDVKSTTLKEAFIAAGKSGEIDWFADDSGNEIFANNTYHTLKMFYLERGGSDSNLYLKYNLSSYPATGVYKVDQYGEKIPGAEFSVYKAESSSYKISDEAPVYTGITDASGQMVFVDEDGMPLTLQEIKDKFGEYFVLRETDVPSGYRLVSQDIHLHVVGTDGNQVLLCENTYDSGVWASPNLLVTAPNTLTNVEGGSIEYYGAAGEEKGTLFAVVLKYVGPRDTNGVATDENLKSQSNWAPVYGNDEDGYTVVDTSGKDFITAAIDTAQKYTESQNVFELSASGQMQATLEGMPGDISLYYHMLPASEKGKAEYTVAYYYSTAKLGTGEKPWEGISSANTVRIDAENETNVFERAFGATIQVPNLINRLFAQKLDEEGSLVNGAKFSMYAVKEVDNDKTSGNDTTIYYVADDGTLIYLAADADGDNAGKATVQGGTKDAATYEVNDATGVITVTIAKGETYEIIPVQCALDGSGVASTLAKDEVVRNDLSGKDIKNPSDENGTATFTNMLSGTYYVREVSAPTGYAINPTEVMVLVTDDAVYANAGTADDGVTVGRGPGYVVSSLKQFASLGDVDNTLTWIFEMMRVSGVSKTFADSNFSDGVVPTWGYLKTNGDGTNLTSSTTNEGDEGVGDALRTYLKYDTSDEANTLFNYTVNAERYGNSGGEAGGNAAQDVRRRLYTNVGWSYYEIYQDWLWALEEGGADKDGALTDGASYSILTDNGVASGNLLEIANLFSRSTYIQVTDQKVSNLEISKTVVNAPEGGDAKSQEFQFTVKLYEPNASGADSAGGETGNGSGDATGGNSGNDGSSVGADENPGVTSSGEFGDGSDDGSAAGAGSDLGENSSNDSNGEPDNGSSSETARTPLTGSYKYTVYDIAADGTRTVAKDENEDPIVDTISNENGNITLKHNQVVVIEGLPAGAYYVVTEAGDALDNYTTTVSQNDEDAVSGTTAEGELNWRIENGNIVNTTTVDCVNTYVAPVDIVIEKIDGATKKPLSDALFVLYRNDAKDGEDEMRSYWHGNDGFKSLADDETESSVALATDGNGALTFSGVETGTYYLKEIEAPDGYNLLAGVITVQVKKGVVSSAVGTDSTNYTVALKDAASSDEGADSGADGVADGEAGGNTDTVEGVGDATDSADAADATDSAGATGTVTYIITVPNETGEALPNTGGVGTSLYTLGGFALVAAALMCGLVTRRRQEGRDAK